MVKSPATSVPPAGKKKIEKPRRLKWYHHLAAFLLFAGLRLLSWTWRFRITDRDAVEKASQGPVIFCIWHNRLASSMVVWERYVKPKSRAAGLVALISASHDGGMLARGLKYFNVESVRGSTSRRGAQALLELTSWTDRGYAVAITPDGPRGPRYEIHEGILSLAQVTGLRILPVCVHAPHKLQFRSWDRFQVPLPFAAAEVRFGEAMGLARDASDEERAAARRELRRRMLEMTED